MWDWVIKNYRTITYGSLPVRLERFSNHESEILNSRLRLPTKLLH